MQWCPDIGQGGSTAAALAAFLGGFNALVPLEHVRKFSPSELKQLVNGPSAL